MKANNKIDKKQSSSKKKNATKKQKLTNKQKAEFSKMNTIEWFPFDPYCD